MHHRSDALRQQAATTTIREVPEALYLAVLAEGAAGLRVRLAGLANKKSPGQAGAERKG